MKGMVSADDPSLVHSSCYRARQGMCGSYLNEGEA
jgi:hypothetical protein